MESMNQVLLALTNISISFQAKIILQNINGQVCKGSVVALMGKNGIGKSCLLQTISGLLPLKSGEMKLNGRDLKDFTIKELAQTLAVVLTEKVHVDFLKVIELVSLGRSPFLNQRGHLAQHDQNYINEVMDLMNISMLKNLYLSDLSDGQKQKVMIARALAQDPQLLILDEPTTFLDIPSKLELMNLLKKIAVEKNIAILLSSHDADLACEFSDHIWHINHLGQMSQELPADARKNFFKPE
jgi:iron complex transport system ATP-binding protein